MPYSQQDAILAIQDAIDDPYEVIAILGDLDTNVTIPESVLKDALDTMSRTLSGKNSAILYSGGGGISHEYAIGIAQADSTVAIIDHTNAGILLDSDHFRVALEDSVGLTEANALIFGSTTNGIRNPDGWWDEVSHDFIVNLDVSEIRTITMNAMPYNVFAQTEMPALLQNSSVETINGLSKSEYQDYFDGRKPIISQRCQSRRQRWRPTKI